ncbi:hypothetical protein C1701_14045 [Actinoalloteichus sp. AHMU CJ021]|uniref:hypothetical protein n=1 Tax=Actinoalloteichus TaxID=65496 RepID=UPI00040347DC|nr:hypothetical protein [Actinoalloteichus caeruleus]AUS79299.1 hypothetical protein C1701_14045 [Actinoalloteichus sp. AHMU CJ021]
MDGAEEVTAPARRTSRQWSATVPAVDPTGRLTTLALTLTVERSAVALVGSGTRFLVLPSGVRQVAAALRTRRRLAVPAHIGPTTRTLSVAPTAMPGALASGARLTLRSASQVAAYWPLMLGPGPARSLARLLDQAADQCQPRR